MKDEVFAGGDWGNNFTFNEDVAQVFDDMLVRSVPFYKEQQRLIQEIGAKFWQPGTVIYDLGCSLATTMINLARSVPDAPKLVGYDNSHPMIARANEMIEGEGLKERIEVRHADFNEDLGAMNLDQAGFVTLCWTLQFVRPLKRDRLIKKIYEGLADGGALVVTEKILTNDSDMNRFFIDFYYDFKRRNGYSEEEILKKREALENVLVPYRIDENMELFRRNGFTIVEPFFQWYNFVGFLCVKRG